MKIVNEDVVDWEPLNIRFRTERKLTEDEANDLVRFIQTWFDDTSKANPGVWRFAKEWQVTLDLQGEVTASCELMPSDAVMALSTAIEEKYPIVRELRLGLPLRGPVAAKDWTVVPARCGHNEDRDFTISFSPITIGQFQEFLEVAEGVRELN